MDPENNVENIVSSAGGKKKLIIIGVIVLAVIVVGYLINGFVGRTAGDKLAENILENQLGGNVDIDSNDGSVSIVTDQGTFTSGDSAKWPSDMPSDVPKFTKGKITVAGSSLTGGTGWQVMYEGVNKGDFDAYHNTLKSAGWTDIGTFSADINIIQMSKGENSLMMAIDAQSKAFTLTVYTGE